MLQKCQAHFIALFFLSFLTFMVPGTAAHAAYTSPDCTSFDQDIDAASQSLADQMGTFLQAASNAYGITAAGNACVQTMMSLFSTISSSASMLSGIDPIAIAVTAAISAMIAQVINSACSAVMGSVQSIATSLQNIFTICLPLPHLGSFHTPTWNASGCSGGLAIPLLNLTNPTPQTSYGYRQFMPQN